MILHIDMDAFFASIEQAINPRLKGKPLIVGSRTSRMHTVVCAASYEAKAFGIHSGMPSKEAFQTCPNLEFVPANQEKYIWTSERIMGLLEGYGLAVNYASIDEFQMDVSGSLNPLALAADIQDRIYREFKVTASIGIARNWILAKLASKLKKPKGITLINDLNLRKVLSEASLEKLCGMAGKTGAILKESGLKTCWDLYLKDPGFFEAEPLTFDKGWDKPKSVGHSYTLPKSIENPWVIRAWIRLLSEMVATRLRQGKLASRTIHLWLNGPQIGNFSRQKTISQPTCDGYEISRQTLKIMAYFGFNRPKIRAIGVTCSNISMAQKEGYFFRELERREEVNKAVDRINSRFGENTIQPAITILTQGASR